METAAAETTTKRTDDEVTASKAGEETLLTMTENDETAASKSTVNIFRTDIEEARTIILKKLSNR